MTPDDLIVETVRARSSATFVVPVAFDSLPGSIATALDASKRFTVKAVTSSGASLTVGFTWRVWADRVDLRFFRAADGFTRVDASWEPTLSTTVIDYGQGAKDLRRLCKELLRATAG